MRPASCTGARPHLLEHVAVSVPCGTCGGRYDVTLRHILLAQDMRHEGCSLHDERECPPLTYAPLGARRPIDALSHAWSELAGERAALRLGGDATAVGVVMFMSV